MGTFNLELLSWPKIGLTAKQFKPWPNGVASSRKLRTWVYLRLRLARTCVHSRWLAMTCAHFGWDQICTQVDASFSPFGHPIQVNASPVTSINLLLVNKIEDSLLWNVFICDFRVLARKLACPFGHPTQVSTQLASTCDYLLVHLTRALKTNTAAFCKRATDVVVVRQVVYKILLQENGMTAKHSIGWIQSNSKLVSAKHWTYLTPNECINASVMILPNEKNINCLIKLI